MLASTGLGQVGFAAIAPVITSVYDVSDLMVTLLVLPFVVMFIPIIFPANYLYDHYGMQLPITIAAILTIAG